ncbi:hypothetical protein D3C81_1935700 [compost metagenome]
MVAACAAASILTPGNWLTIGAEMEAAVIMATVPEPCIKRTSVAIKNGINTGDSGRLATCCASKVPVPLSRNTAPSAPPAPVTSKIIPAACKPSSSRSSVSCLSTFGIRV